MFDHMNERNMIFLRNRQSVHKAKTEEKRKQTKQNSIIFDTEKENESTQNNNPSISQKYPAMRLHVCRQKMCKKTPSIGAVHVSGKGVMIEFQAHAGQINWLIVTVLHANNFLP